MQTQNRLISIQEACRRSSLSRTSINKYRAAGLFPRPIKLGEKRLAFVESEVDDWIEKRIADSRGEVLS